MRSEHAWQLSFKATALRDDLVRQREVIIFETVFSDLVGDKLGFLGRRAQAGHAVVPCFIGSADALLARGRLRESLLNYDEAVLKAAAPTVRRKWLLMVGVGCEKGKAGRPPHGGR